MIRPFAIASGLLLATTVASSAGIVSDSNLAKDPPLFAASAAGCSIEVMFKSVAFGTAVHGYAVVTTPSGSKLELRGGPSKFDSSVSGEFGSSGSGDQPPGNPFGCTTTHKLGVVVPYIGPHGRLGEVDGMPVYSPDGNVANPKAKMSIGSFAYPNACKLANCIMTTMKALGGSCKIYTAGTGVLRNSNTILSAAMASCGVADPRPAGLHAPGWGEAWE